ncbi:hypothetical protein NM688_g8311 [Phlebia brevispora]|uniref:Uncharacterized protein n=1 Tax=Phlebia brevispora TaxID=194682 RepID=A0ACC1RUK3_9APHY|nr:hypothetical protein NM688_g8311 [Phlebia brevispora]
MLSRLSDAFYQKGAPSVLLVVGNFGATIHVLHLLLEDGTVERFSLTTPSSTTTFRYSGTTEQSREELGSVTLYVGDGETASRFLDDVEAKARELWDTSSMSRSAGNVEANQISKDVLVPAALDAIRERVGRAPSMNATQTYPVYVVHIMRSRMGRILTEPTSLP